MRPCSNPTSRSSRGKAELEVGILDDEARAERERKQHELELQCRRRELESHQQQMELEAQKEEMELAKTKQEKELPLKMKKMEFMEQTSSRGSVSSACRSVRMQKVKIRMWVISSKNNCGPQPETRFEEKSEVVYHRSRLMLDCNNQ